MNQPFQQGGAPSAVNFNYQPRTAESLTRRAEGGSNDFDRPIRKDITLWKPKKGDNVIRILPPTWQNADYYGFDIYIHYGVGPDRRGSYLCLKHHQGAEDPIDSAYNAARREGNMELAKEFRATHRMAYWLIDRASPEDGPQIWLAPIQAFDSELAAAGLDPQTKEVLYIDHPEQGFDISFRKDGEGLMTKYVGPQIHRRPSPLNVDPAVTQRWLDFIVANPIPSVLQFYPAERIQAAMNGELPTAGSATEFAPQPETPQAQPPAQAIPADEAALQTQHAQAQQAQQHPPLPTPPATNGGMPPAGVTQDIPF